MGYWSYRNRVHVSTPGGGVAVIIEDGDDTFDTVHIFNEVVPPRLYKVHHSSILEPSGSFCMLNKLYRLI